MVARPEDEELRLVGVPVARGARRRRRCRSSGRASERRRAPRSRERSRPRKNAWPGRVIGGLLRVVSSVSPLFSIHFRSYAPIGHQDGLDAGPINSHLAGSGLPDRDDPRRPGRAPSGRWSDGEGPVYRRLARALERGDRPRRARAGRATAVRADAGGGARALADDGRVGLRAAARGRARREPPGKRDSGAWVRLARAGPAAPRGSRRAPSGGIRSTAASWTARARHDRVPRGPPAGARDARRGCSPASTSGCSRELARGPGYLPMGLPALRQAIARHLTGWGVADGRGAGHGDPRRAAGDRPRGGALSRARRRCPRRGSDVPRLDRHLHRPRRASGPGAGRRRRGLGRRASRSSSRARGRG